jgi:hypothetical protein
MNEINLESLQVLLTLSLVTSLKGMKVSRSYDCLRMIFSAVSTAVPPWPVAS